MRSRNPGPKFPHASSHKVGVAIEVGTSLQRPYPARALSRKHRQVHLHALRQRQHQLADVALISLFHVGKQSKAISQTSQQFTFGWVVLLPSQMLLMSGHSGRSGFAERSAILIKITEAQIPRQERSVG